MLNKEFSLSFIVINSGIVVQKFQGGRLKFEIECLRTEYFEHWL